jgi:predicted component of type VI protein secretion system
MKKLPPYVILFALFYAALGCITGCTTTSPAASSSSLDQAIETAANDINTSLPEGAVAAVINFSSSSKGLSE